MIIMIRYIDKKISTNQNLMFTRYYNMYETIAKSPNVFMENTFKLYQSVLYIFYKVEKDICF